ncbi:unnamed protein product [Alopecurus aequalis]
MAIASPSPRFHLSLHLQNSNPAANRKPRPTPTAETLRRRLLRKGVSPTPKILHALRKKEAHKSLRRARKDTSTANAPPKEEALVAEEEASFRAASEEYRALMGRPWDCARSGTGPPRVASGEEGLDGLRKLLEGRKGGGVQWLLDDDVEKEEADDAKGKQRRVGSGWISEVGDEERKIELLVSRLIEVELSLGDWRLTRMMKQADLIYNEDNLLQILKGLEAQGNWRQAVAVTEWVYNENSYKHRRSRFVYTKLLSILGKALMPTEALRVFAIMRGDAQIYPDMAAYHSIAVTLGRAGLLSELIKIIDIMRQKPSKRAMMMRRKDWDPLLEPDVLIYNSVLNACVLSQQWKGVFWVFQKMRFSGLTPTGATFGLAMEVMLKAKKYEFVQKFFEKMQRKGVPPRATTYKVLVRAFWEQGKVNEAVEAVQDMEQRGVVGAASVYYELACCLCNKGRWKDAMIQPYLLEHALDSILERGEIPDIQLFTENICQTIAQSDYGRTLLLMNAMAAASVNVSELQWSDLLEQNLHRFSVDALKDLMTHLCASETIKTDPAHVFFRALQSQCATTLVKEKYFVADCGDTVEHEVDKCSSSNPMEQDQLSCKDPSSTNIYPGDKGSSEVSDCSTDVPELVAKSGFGGDIVLCDSHSENKENEQCNLGHWGTQVSAIDRVLDSMNSYGNSSSYEAMPAASEILELWELEGVNDIFVSKKESRAAMRG